MSMSKKMLFYECAPLVSVIFARAAVDRDERDEILESLRNDPERKNARAILAQKLLDDPDAPDIRKLYDKIRE